MNWPSFYLTIACAMTFYTLGRIHENGHTHWKNNAAALGLGLLWPLAIAWGFLAKRRAKGVE